MSDSIIDTYYHQIPIVQKSINELYHASRFGIDCEIKPISRKYCDLGKGF